jgi:hypothetical protein
VNFCCVVHGMSGAMLSRVVDFWDTCRIDNSNLENTMSAQMGPHSCRPDQTSIPMSRAPVVNELFYCGPKILLIV